MTEHELDVILDWFDSEFSQVGLDYVVSAHTSTLLQLKEKFCKDLDCIISEEKDESELIE